MFAKFSVDNWLTLMSLIFVAIGGFFIYCQWWKSVKIRRAEFINQLLEKLRFDKSLTSAMYTMDYNQDWYDNADAFHNSELECSIDKLLSYMDYICYLKVTGNISKTEFKIFQYEINRACVSYSSKVYLWNLYLFSKKNRTNCSFIYLINYGIASKLLPNNFKESKSLYRKTLNW